MSDRLNAALNGCLLRPLLLAVLTLAFSILVCSAADQVGSGTVESDVLTSFGSDADLAGVGALGGIGPLGGVGAHGGVGALGSVGAWEASMPWLLPAGVPRMSPCRWPRERRRPTSRPRHCIASD